MNVLEKILEEMLNYERVVKTDEDLEWNRAMYKCSEIIRSHMVEKEKVSSAEIISRNIDGKPYYEIKYQKVGEGHYTVGYSSYKLNFVVEWLNKYFEFCGEVKVSVVDDKDTNVPSNDEIEPVSEEFLKDCAETSAKYRKKPVEIEAFQYTGHLRDSSGRICVPEWAIEAFENGTLMYMSFSPLHPPCDLYVRTLEGDMHAKVGDYIIKGVNGELYPCKPDIFEKTYEKGD